jgi:predicted dehydrogenase
VHLTPEEQALGRRNFLRAIAGVPVIAGLGAATLARGPVSGGPVRIGYIGVGGEGRVLLANTDPAYAHIIAMADINPAQLALADAALEKAKLPKAVHYAEWREMIQKESLEGVVIAVPLWMHTEITCACLEAGLHVLCEKMMAWDVEGCERMRATARKTGKILEIGYQRNYNQVYQAAYEGIVKAGVLGDVFLARLAWHRNGNWRRHGDPPAAGYDPSKWGYPTWEHLLNWRLYKKYSRGLLAELASHQVNVSNWFFGAEPEAVIGTGGIYRFKDGREVDDHVYATFEYPGGRSAVFSTVESNAFERNYEVFYGTKATLLLQGESEAYLFEEGEPGAPAAAAARPTGIDVQPKGSGPALSASESRAADAAGRPAVGGSTGTGQPAERLSAYKAEVSGFCSAVRVGTPLRCGPDRAIGSAVACITAVDAVAQKARLPIRSVAASAS